MPPGLESLAESSCLSLASVADLLQLASVVLRCEPWVAASSEPSAGRQASFFRAWGAIVALWLGVACWLDNGKIRTVDMQL